jgi:hypothetical protein
MESTAGGKEAMGTMKDCSDDPRNPRKSPIVKVAFTPPHCFEFSCPEVSMRAAGKIQLHQASPTDQWAFLHPDDLPVSEFSFETAADGKTMTIHDKHTRQGEFHYGVTVRDTTGEHHSDDDHRIVTNPPMIRNQ